MERWRHSFHNHTFKSHKMSYFCFAVGCACIKLWRIAQRNREKPIEKIAWSIKQIYSCTSLTKKFTCTSQESTNAKLWTKLQHQVKSYRIFVCSLFLRSMLAGFLILHFEVKRLFVYIRLMSECTTLHKIVISVYQIFVKSVIFGLSDVTYIQDSACAENAHILLTM